MRPAEDLVSWVVQGLLPGRIGFMILSCHDSVGPSFRQRGELRDMPVQIDPLNDLQSRVMQEGWPGVGWVPSPGADRTGHNENCCTRS